MSRCHDISVPLGGALAGYPGDPPWIRETAPAAGEVPYELSRLSMSAHAGTHLDAPSHFFPGAATVDAIPVSDFFLPALVVEVRHPELVLPEEVPGELREGEAVLFRTENSRRGIWREGRFPDRWTALSPEAADVLVQRKVRLAGIDFLSVDPPGEECFPVHRALLGAGVLVLEGLDLSMVEAGRYRLVCLPLRIEGGEASPVRAVLLPGEEASCAR